MVKSKAELSWSRNWKLVFSPSSLSTSLSLFLSSTSVHFSFMVMSSKLSFLFGPLPHLSFSLLLLLLYLFQCLFHSFLISFSLPICLISFLTIFLSVTWYFFFYNCLFIFSQLKRPSEIMNQVLSDRLKRQICDRLFFTIFELSDKSRISCFSVWSFSAKSIE